MSEAYDAAKSVSVLAQNTKQDRLQNWTKPQAKKTKIANTKARVSLQSEEPLKVDCIRFFVRIELFVWFVFSVSFDTQYSLNS
jgi:hypothetical protein